MSYQDVVDSAVGYWPMQETSGTVAVDATGNGHNGALLNLSFSADKVAGPTAWLPSAIAATGVANQRIIVPDHVDLKGGKDFTIGLWMQFVPGQSCIHMSKALNGSYKDYLLFYQALDVVRFSGTSNSGLKADYNNPPTGWGYASASYEHATRIARLYYNGVPVATDTGGTSHSTSATLTFFQQEYASSSASTNGAVAGAGYWDRVLTAEEHAVLFAGPQAKPWLAFPQEGQVVCEGALEGEVSLQVFTQVGSVVPDGGN